MTTKPSLAERMRPKTIHECIGQIKLLGDNKPLTRMYENKFLPSSMIFWGPPSSGKTTIARILAKQNSKSYVELSAVNAGKKELQEAVNKSKLYATPTILFLDEIHRFNKAQQDYLLPHVEKGTIKLIGATTENPSFEVNNALLSRSQVFTFEKITAKDITEMLQKALEKDKDLKHKNIDENQLMQIAKRSDGDIRKALNVMETLIQLYDTIQEKDIEQLFENFLTHDKNGESHYNLISALHKSMRDSHVNASIYYLTRLIEGGEDPKYVVRRMMRFASEDIGIANNNALVLANSVKETILFVGMPEAKTALVQLAIYLAKSKKSNLAYRALGKAQKVIKDTGNLEVPKNLRNAPSEFLKKQGYGKGYIYAPENQESAKKQKHLPDEIEHENFLD